MRVNEIITEIKKGQKDSNGYTRCWPGKHAEGTKKGRNGGQVRNCVPNESEELHENSAPTQQQWMQSIKQKYPNVKFPQNKTTMQIFAMVPGKGQVGVFDPRTQVTELELADVIKPGAQTSTPPRHAYSIALQGRPGKDFMAEYAWEALNSVFPREYPTGTDSAKEKVAEVRKRGSAIVKTGIASEDIADTYVAKLAAKRVPVQFWKIVGGELEEEFDLIEGIIENLAKHNGVDAEVIWEDLESLTDDELYVFATTTPIMEDWQKANKQDRTAGMSQKAVNAYRRENPGSKLKTAVTTKPSKLKKGSKASKRRKSYCSRSRGQMKMHSISCAKTPDKAICKARRRWNCE